MTENRLVKNAGAFNHQIEICVKTEFKDADGFVTPAFIPILTTWAQVKTTKGMTIIKNGSYFEKVLTNFTIRFPQIEITREMGVLFNGKMYSIEYLNNVDEENVLLEIQAKEVRRNG